MTRTGAFLPRAIAASRALPLVKIGAGIVSLAVLGAALLLTAGERFSDREASLAETSAPMPISVVQPAPAPPPRQETRPVAALRPRAPEKQVEIPAPLRGPDPALAPRRPTAFASAPSPEAVQNTDASDSTAAIDWLLQGGRGRRHIENP